MLPTMSFIEFIIFLGLLAVLAILFIPDLFKAFKHNESNPENQVKPEAEREWKETRRTKEEESTPINKPNPKYQSKLEAERDKIRLRYNMTKQKRKKARQTKEENLKLLKATSKIPKNDLIVLSVDDDTINLKIRTSILMRSGKVAEVINAYNGSDALDILRSRDDIDLILLNIIMPIMGGIEMLKIVRADDKFQNLPIIIITTNATKESEVKELGANGFIVTPLYPLNLIQEITTVFLEQDYQQS